MKCTFIVWCREGNPGDTNNDICKITIKQKSSFGTSIFSMMLDKNSLKDILCIIDGLTKSGDNFEYIDEYGRVRSSINFVEYIDECGRGHSYGVKYKRSKISFFREGDEMKFAPEYKEKIREIICNMISLNKRDTDKYRI